MPAVLYSCSLIFLLHEFPYIAMITAITKVLYKTEARRALTVLAHNLADAEDQIALFYR